MVARSSTTWLQADVLANLNKDILGTDPFASKIYIVHTMLVSQNSGKGYVYYSELPMLQ